MKLYNHLKTPTDYLNSKSRLKNYKYFKLCTKYIRILQKTITEISVHTTTVNVGTNFNTYRDNPTFFFINLKDFSNETVEMNNATKPILNLKQFMLRRQVINLYRRILRTIKEVPDERYRAELREWARNDFQNNAHHRDEITIKMMITYGERSLKELQTSLSLAK